MNQFESIQRQLAEIQAQLDQCATKEDIKEFKDTISKEKYYIPSTKISADELEQLLKKNHQRFKAAMCDVNLETKIEGELYADPIKFGAAKSPRELFEANEITVNQMRELIGINKTADGDVYLESIKGEYITLEQLKGNEPICVKNLTYDLTVIKANAIPATYMQPGISFKALDNAIKNELAAREAADKKLAKSVQEQEFKTVEQRKYDAVIADVTRSLRYDYHILITFIDVQKMVDFFIDKGVKRGELDPYLYAAKESVKFIENLNK